MIDREYRTIPFRECTGIGGSSMGGIMALYAGVHYNRWFSKAACISTAMGFCMNPVMDDIRRSAISPDSRFFLSWGTHEAHGIEDPHREDTSSKTYHWNTRVRNALERKGAAAVTFCQVEGYHCEASWEQQVGLFMDYLWMR
jgi:predicted alpha/beta superfamily hydrolase